MAFLRFTRDKRGYEHFQLVQPATNRRGQSKPRVLYWFRSPPNVRVGREPFDAGVRAALEAQNPDVEFDWKQILATPVPSPEADHWRERRRQERISRQPAADEDESPESADDSEARLPSSEGTSVGRPVRAQAGAAGAPGPQSGAIDMSRRNRRRRRGPPGRPHTLIERSAEELTAELTGSEGETESEGDPKSTASDEIDE